MAERRRGAEHLKAEHGVSERRACQVIGIDRSSKRRPSGRIEEAKPIRRLHELTEQYPRFGHRKNHAILRGEGLCVGRDRLRLIGKREGLQVSRKQRKRRQRGKNTTEVDRALYPNHVWSYDFFADQSVDGRRLRFLTVIYEFTREAIWIECDRFLNSHDVVRVSNQLVAIRGHPAIIKSDTASSGLPYRDSPLGARPHEVSLGLDRPILRILLTGYRRRYERGRVKYAYHAYPQQLSD